MQMPSPESPSTLVAYIVATVLSVPALTLFVKGIFFFAKASGKLDLIDSISADVKQLRHDRNDETFSVEMSLTVIENDLNAIQKHINLPVRAFPDRRAGPSDRRQA